MEILNLYAGLGGNRKRWSGAVTSVEWSTDIAKTYKGLYPNDKVVVGDAHEFLLNNHESFDFIWSSPPCQSHSRMVKATRHKIRKYPDLRLYEEIIFLTHFSKSFWVVENVAPYYEPLIPPTAQIGRHMFWSNFDLSGIQDVKRPKGFINKCSKEGARQLKEWLGIHYSNDIYYDGNHDPAQVLRNCVHPDLGRQIFDKAENAVFEAWLHTT